MEAKFIESFRRGIALSLRGAADSREVREVALWWYYVE